MSEVSDATQIVLVMGRGGYLLGRITVRMAIAVYKLLNTLYLAKWRGKTSFNHLRQAKGDDLLFINMNTEDERELLAIEEEMKEHGIMYARLPDLCGGDHRTQYVISQSDAERFRAFLLDHGVGAFKRIKVGPVRPEDYIATGEDEQTHRKTEEAQRLEESAQTAEGLYQKETKKQKRGPETAAEERPKIIRLFTEGKEREARTPEEYAAVISDNYPTCVHDKSLDSQGTPEEFEKNPMEKRDTFCLYEMPDGLHAVVVPKEDVRETVINETTGEMHPGVFTLFPEQHYLVINMEDPTGDTELLKGGSVIPKMKEQPVKARFDELTNLVRAKAHKVTAEITRKVTER